MAGGEREDRKVMTMFRENWRVAQRGRSIDGLSDFQVTENRQI